MYWLFPAPSGDHIPSSKSKRLRSKKGRARFSVEVEPTPLLDPTTFLEAVRTEEARSTRSGGVLALAILELREKDEETFQRASQIVQGKIRAYDLSARLGSDAIAVLLPETDQDGVSALAGLLLDALSGQEIRASASTHVATPPIEVNVRDRREGPRLRTVSAELTLVERLLSGYPSLFGGDV